MFHSFFGFDQSCLLMQPANDSYIYIIFILYLIRKTEYPDIQHQASIDKHKLYKKDGYCAGLKTQGESVLKPHFILIASRDSHLLWTSVSS